MNKLNALYSWWLEQKLVVDIVLGIVIAFSVVALGLNKSDFLDLLLSISSVLVGALLAFKVDAKNKERDQYRSDAKALSDALFALGRMGNAVAVMKKSMRPYLHSDFQLAFAMPALRNVNYGDLSFDYSALSFLLSSSDKSLLLELSTQKDRFEQVLGAAKIRNKYYIEDYQDIYEKKSLDGRHLTAKQLKDEIGERIFESCMSSGQNMKEVLLTCEENVLPLQDRLHTVAGEIFPDRDFLRFVFADQSPPELAESIPASKPNKKKRRRSR